MLAAGIPVAAIEKKLHVKGETIQEKLKFFFEKGRQDDLWEEVNMICPNLPQGKIEKLFSVFKEKEADKQAFRKAGARRHKIWKGLTPKQKDKYYVWATSDKKSNPPFVTQSEE